MNLVMSVGDYAALHWIWLLCQKGKCTLMRLRPQSIFIKKYHSFWAQYVFSSVLGKGPHLTVLNMLLIWFSGKAWSLPPSRLLCTFMAHAIRQNILIQPHTRCPNAHPFGTTQSLRLPASFVATTLDCKTSKRTLSFETHTFWADKLCNS